MQLSYSRPFSTILSRPLQRSPNHFPSSCRPFPRPAIYRPWCQQAYSSRSGKSTYGFRDAVADSNLKWTVPISLVLGAGLWYYAQNEILSNGAANSTSVNHKADEPLPPLIVLGQPVSDTVIDPSTQVGFPAELAPAELSLTEPMRLIGLGVRTVSFLSVKVYVAGLYADPRVLRALRVIPGWSDDVSKEKFLSGQASGPKAQQDGQSEDDVRGEALIRNLLDVPVNFAIRIAPVRPTDFTHLRDGFCRSLLARLKLGVKQGFLTEADSERASQSINTFRSFFPTGVSVPKGKALTLIRSANGNLIVGYDGKRLGELNDPIVAKELFLAYFADRDPISTKFKESVAEGFASLYGP